MSRIREKTEELNRAGVHLGNPTSDEVDVPDGGRRMNFEHASVFWSPRTGAHAVFSPLLEEYVKLGGPTSQLGYPLADSQTTADAAARFSRFEHGDLYFDRRFTDLGIYVVLPPPICEHSPQTLGEWHVPPYTSGVVGVHAALLPHHKVLFFTYKVPPNCPSAPSAYGASSVLDLQTGYVSTPAVFDPISAAGDMENLFCSGHAFLPSGELMVGGGEREDDVVRKTEAVKAVHVFSPGGAGGGTWRRVASCARGRWYSTCTTLPDGRVIIVAGSVRQTHNATGNLTFEIYDSYTNTVSPEHPLPNLYGWTSYPFVLTVPGSRVLIHAGTRTHFVDLGTLTFSPVVLEAATRPNRQGRTYGVEGTAVLLPLRPGSTPPWKAEVMMIGGGGPHPVERHTPATASCEILDLSDPAPHWALTTPMKNRRVMPDAVLLPDGTVFVCNGSAAGHADNGVDPVYESEVFDPRTRTWTRQCHMTVPRLYHATALLLPDGRVMTAGTDCAWNPAPFNQSQFKVEIFSPTYCYKDRPSIGHPPGAVWPGQEFSVSSVDAKRITSAVLIRCGSVTHSFNSDQRFVEIPIVGVDFARAKAPRLRLAVPGDTSIVPPGYYLLFLVDEAGVPSIGRYIRLRRHKFAFRPGRGVKAIHKELTKEHLPEVLKRAVELKSVKEAEVPPFDKFEELSDRIATVEQHVARMAAFIEAQERPLFSAHGTHSATLGGTPPSSPHPPHQEPHVPDKGSHGGEGSDES